MAVEFFIPKLGQTVEEVTLINWLVKDGEKVSQGQEVLEVETDKATFPVEANGKGYIHIGPFEAGQVLPVLTVVAIIGKEDDKFEAAAVAQPESEEVQSALPEAEPAVTLETVQDPLSAAPHPRALSTGRFFPCSRRASGSR